MCFSSISSSDFFLFFYFLFFLFEPQLHADLLLHFFFFFLSLLKKKIFLSFLLFFFFFFSLWFIGLLHRFFLFCVCIFGQTLTIAQFRTNVYKYVKYIAQGCCESVMDILFLFLRGCIWTQFILIIMHFSNLILLQIKRIDHNIYHICIY